MVRLHSIALALAAYQPGAEACTGGLVLLIKQFGFPNVPEITDGSTTFAPATTVPVMPEHPGFEVVSKPVITKTFYVDAASGRDSNDGLTEATAFKSIRNAFKSEHKSDGMEILVKDGSYPNYKYGTGEINNPAAVTITDLNDIRLAAYPGHKPSIPFDGSGGISLNRVSRVEIEGFTITGGNYQITKDQAMADRLLHSNFFSGRGIAVWEGNNVKITHNTVSACPNSGIRMNKADYGIIAYNTVFDNTWWSSSAESGIVFADSRSLDTEEFTKLFLVGNTVYGNINKIPYYNANYEDPEYLAEHQMHSARENYGTELQTFIIDGSGVYVTRNSDKYLHGRFELSGNKAYGNGINGLVVHKTFRADVFDNKLWNNGQVPRELPEDRQAFAGLVLNSSEDVRFFNNNVTTTLDDDFAFKNSGSSFTVDGTGNNFVCNGLVSDDMAAYVTVTADAEVCK